MDDQALQPWPFHPPPDSDHRITTLTTIPPPLGLHSYPQHVRTPLLPHRYSGHHSIILSHTPPAPSLNHSISTLTITPHRHSLGQNTGILNHPGSYHDHPSVYSHPLHAPLSPATIHPSTPCIAASSSPPQTPTHPVPCHRHPKTPSLPTHPTLLLCPSPPPTHNPLLPRLFLLSPLSFFSSTSPVFFHHSFSSAFPLPCFSPYLFLSALLLVYSCSFSSPSHPSFLVVYFTSPTSSYFHRTHLHLSPSLPFTLSHP